MSHIERTLGNGHASADPTGIAIDPYRMFPFPNAIREQRKRAGFDSLLALSQQLPDIPYIRLSKIERGEVFAKAQEIITIAHKLGVEDPKRLLTDVEDANFSVALWAGLRGETLAMNRESEELAMLLAAAFRARRGSAPDLTLAKLNNDYGLPAVIISRIENAVKPFDRWNAETLSAACEVLGIEDSRTLASHLRTQYENGALTEWLRRIPGAPEREARTRERVAALRTELQRIGAVGAGSTNMAKSNRANNAKHSPKPISDAISGRTDGQANHAHAMTSLQVLGVPLGDGVIEPYPNPQHIMAPAGSGPNAYALRMCRASLGAAIPASAILIVDPDRSPLHSGIGVLRVENGLRVLTITTNRDGQLYGHSSNPEKELLLDAIAPSELAMVTAILLD